MIWIFDCDKCGKETSASSTNPTAGMRMIASQNIINTPIGWIKARLLDDPYLCCLCGSKTTRYALASKESALSFEDLLANNMKKEQTK